MFIQNHNSTVMSMEWLYMALCGLSANDHISNLNNIFADRDRYLYKYERLENFTDCKMVFFQEKILVLWTTK